MKHPSEWSLPDLLSAAEPVLRVVGLFGVGASVAMAKYTLAAAIGVLVAGLYLRARKGLWLRRSPGSGHNG